MVKKAWAVWKGSIKEGGGTISTETGVLREAPYGFKSRFESGEGFEITASHLTVTAKIPGASAAQFQEIANKAKTGCPVSKLLKARITMDAKLES